MNKIELLLDLQKLRLQADDYIFNIPPDLHTAILDNKYADSAWRMVELLVDAHFGDEAEHVAWFLFEWENGVSTEAWDQDGDHIRIEDASDFINWMGWRNEQSLG